MATLNRARLKARTRKRVILFVLLLVTEMAVSPMLFYLLHQFLMLLGQGKSGGSGIDFSYLNALKALRLVKSGNLWISLQIIFVLMLVYFFIDLRPKLDSVDTVKITEDIVVPVAAGNGQHGNERFLTEKEREQKYQVFKFSGTEVPKGKGGLVVHYEKIGHKEFIYYIGADMHSLIIGASGSGKTRRILLETLWLQLLTGLSIVISDVKGEIYYYTSEFAKSLEYKLYVVDFRNPVKSDHYNYLKPILEALAAGDRAKAIDYTWDLVSVLVGQQKGEPLWYNGETATIAAGILCVCLDAPREYRNLTNVYYFIAYMCQSDAFGNMPLNDYLDRLPDTHPAKGVFAMAKIAASKTRSSFFTSALGTLRLFTNPNVAEMTGTSDFDLKDIGREKSILYMIIPDEKKTLYPLVSIMITQLYSLQVELANESGLRLPVDTDYDLDEVGNFPYIPVLGNIESAGRSRGIRANLVIQDLQQLEAKYKDDYKNIRTNSQVKLYLKSDDPDTLKFVSETLGKYTVEVSSASASASDGKQKNTNYSSTASLTGRALLEPAEVKRIKSPYSICMVTGEYGAVNVLPDLSEYHLNKIYGMGTEEENIRIIREREAARQEHPVPEEPTLWGIWNDFNGRAEKEEGEVKKKISFLGN